MLPCKVHFPQKVSLFQFAKGVDPVKKYFTKFCAAWGGCLVGFWVWSLDTTIGYLFFMFGILLLAGSWISAARNAKKDKDEK